MEEKGEEEENVYARVPWRYNGDERPLKSPHQMKETQKEEEDHGEMWEGLEGGLVYCRKKEEEE